MDKLYCRLRRWSDFKAFLHLGYRVVWATGLEYFHFEFLWNILNYFFSSFIGSKFRQYQSASAKISLAMTMKYFDNLRKYFCSKRCFIGSESRAISASADNPATLTITDAGISSGSLIAMMIILIRIWAIQRPIFLPHICTFVCGAQRIKLIFCRLMRMDMMTDV